MLFVIYHKINSLPRGRYQDANQYRPEEQAPDEEYPVGRGFRLVNHCVFLLYLKIMTSSVRKAVMQSMM